MLSLQSFFLVCDQESYEALTYEELRQYPDIDGNPNWASLETAYVEGSTAVNGLMSVEQSKDLSEEMLRDNGLFLLEVTSVVAPDKRFATEPEDELYVPLSEDPDWDDAVVVSPEAVYKNGITKFYASTDDSAGDDVYVSATCKASLPLYSKQFFRDFTKVDLLPKILHDTIGEDDDESVPGDIFQFQDAPAPQANIFDFLDGVTPPAAPANIHDFADKPEQPFRGYSNRVVQVTIPEAPPLPPKTPEWAAPPPQLPPLPERPRTAADIALANPTPKEEDPLSVIKGMFTMF